MFAKFRVPSLVFVNSSFTKTDVQCGTGRQNHQIKCLSASEKAGIVIIAQEDPYVISYKMQMHVHVDSINPTAEH